MAHLRAQLPFSTPTSRAKSKAAVEKARPELLHLSEAPADPDEGYQRGKKKRRTDPPWVREIVRRNLLEIAQFDRETERRRRLLKERAKREGWDGPAPKAKIFPL